MKKGIIIAIIVIAALVAAYFIYDTSYGDCPSPRDPAKFPNPWDEKNRNSGGLNQLAKQYADPILGADTNYNGSVVGGFFKGINVFPSTAAAKYYERHLIKYLKSNNALPWWNIKQGELLCKIQ